MIDCNIAFHGHWIDQLAQATIPGNCWPIAASIFYSLNFIINESKFTFQGTVIEFL